MIILAVDTALGACSVAILQDAKLCARRSILMQRGHAEALAPMVDETMRDANLAYSAIELLGVTIGPGTFTGQRVGLAFMRALRLALKIPLHGVSTLATMAAAARAETGLASAAAICDARRGEVYLQVSGAIQVDPTVMTCEEAISRLLPWQAGLGLAGSAAPQMAGALPLSVLSSVREPDALWVGRLALTMPIGQADTAAPLYLRAPDAKLPASRS